MCIIIHVSAFQHYVTSVVSTTGIYPSSWPAIPKGLVIEHSKIVVWQIYVHWTTVKYNTSLQLKEVTLEARGFAHKVPFQSVLQALIQAAVQYDSRTTWMMESVW